MRPAEPAYRRSPEYLEHIGPGFSVPRELQVTPTPLKRVAFVGHRLLASWPTSLKKAGVDTEIDHVLLGLHDFPVLPHPPELYSFQVTHIATRSIMPDFEMFEWARSPAGDTTYADALLKRIYARIDRYLKYGTALRDRMPIFITNLNKPQQEFNGRLIARRGVDSIFELYERINIYLREAVDKLENVYILDVAEIFASIGRRRLQDDSVNVSTHAAVLTNGMHELDANRIEPPRRIVEYYEIEMNAFLLAVWREAEAMYRSRLQIDQVKMICVDLDDTMWRGVLAEVENLDDIDRIKAIEGWPVGIAEALLILKRRGILLCIVSKNDEERVRKIFDRVYHNLLRLDDFAILKINWRPKTENIRQAMAEANLLPRSVVFLDDNPAERAAVKQAFPDIRVIEAPLYYWRRILLWSAETQARLYRRKARAAPKWCKRRCGVKRCAPNRTKTIFSPDLGLKSL